MNLVDQERVAEIMACPNADQELLIQHFDNERQVLIENCKADVRIAYASLSDYCISCGTLLEEIELLKQALKTAEARNEAKS